MNNENELLSQDALAPSEEQQTDVAESISGEATQSDEVPEKFKGKSAAEITKSALEAERQMHEARQEMASMRRQMQETQQYIQMLQAQRQTSSQEEVDPLSIVEKEWDEDPKQATVRGLREIQEQERRKREREQLEQRTREGTEYYYSRRQNDADFVQREKDMVELSKKYAHLVRPEFATAKETYEFLHLAARGAKIAEYEKAAVEKATKTKELIKDEKGKGVSERAGSVSSSTEDALVDLDTFARMSPQQQAAELEKSARRIGRVS